MAGAYSGMKLSRVMKPEGVDPAARWTATSAGVPLTVAKVGLPESPPSA